MAQGSILSTPFRNTFGLEPRVVTFQVTHKEPSESKFWIKELTDERIQIHSTATNCSVLTIRLYSRGSYICLYIKGKPFMASDWIDMADQLEKASAESHFRENLWHLMRQVGGDAAYADTFVLSRIGEEHE